MRFGLLALRRVRGFGLHLGVEPRTTGLREIVYGGHEIRLGVAKPCGGGIVGGFHLTLQCSTADNRRSRNRDAAY